MYNPNSSSTLQELNDGRSYDRKAVQWITQDWIDQQMRVRESEYLRSADCSIFCGTWNVNAKKQEGGLHDWILPPGSTPSDIYAVGFQEIVDLNVMNVGLNSANTIQRAEFWQSTIQECLYTTGFKYTMIAEKFLVGLLLFIFVKEPLVPYVTDVRSTVVAVGIMGVMGNKGGVAIRLSVYDSTICFICAHLAAHRENVSGRNSDFKNIYEKAIFPATVTNSSALSADETITMPSQGAARHMEHDLHISDHEVIFWIGDLNYRIDDSLSTEEVFQRIEQGDLEILRQRDQLNIERARGRVFQGFQEGQLNFNPTYKYQPGTDGYDRRPEKKIRAPAWCDRVLWRVNSTSNKETVTLVEYRRANLMPSDHKPVSTLFNCTLRRVVASNEQVVFQGLLGLLSKHPSKAVPVVEVTGLKANLGMISYEAKQQATVAVKNRGDGIVYWHFLPRLEESALSVSKRWITLDKRLGLLLPGEETTITLTATVDKLTTQQLNTGKDSLQDLLVLRVERSIDHFVEVNADYERSCFGMSLEELVFITEPVATVPLPQSNPDYHLRDGGAAEDSKPRLSIPKELWRLVDALFTGSALKEKGLFNTPADPLDVEAVRYALDHNVDFAPVTPHAVVDCLVGFFSALPKPLLPLQFYPANKLDNASLPAFCRKFLEDLPPLNYNIFVYMLSFMREVLVDESYNRCSAQHMAEVCLQCMTSNITTSDNGSSEAVAVTAAPPGVKATAAMPSGKGVVNYDDVVVLTKEERARRTERQAYLYDVIEFLLKTPNL